METKWLALIATLSVFGFIIGASFVISHIEKVDHEVPCYDAEHNVINGISCTEKVYDDGYIDIFVHGVMPLVCGLGGLVAVVTLLIFLEEWND